MYGTDWCGDTIRAKSFFEAHRIPYDYVDVDFDKEGLEFVKLVNAGRRVVPTIVCQDGSTLVEPTNDQLARAFNAAL